MSITNTYFSLFPVFHLYFFLSHLDVSPIFQKSVLAASFSPYMGTAYQTPPLPVHQPDSLPELHTLL